MEPSSSTANISSNSWNIDFASPLYEHIHFNFCRVCPFLSPLLSGICKKCGYTIEICIHCKKHYCNFCLSSGEVGYSDPNEILKSLTDSLFGYYYPPHTTIISNGIPTPKESPQHLSRSSSSADVMNMSIDGPLTAPPTPLPSNSSGRPQSNASAMSIALNSPFPAPSTPLPSNSFAAPSPMPSQSKKGRSQSNSSGITAQPPYNWKLLKGGSRKKTDLLEDGLGNTYSKRSKFVWHCTKKGDQKKNKCPGTVKESGDSFSVVKAHTCSRHT